VPGDAQSRSLLLFKVARNALVSRIGVSTAAVRTAENPIHTYAAAHVVPHLMQTCDTSSGARSDGIPSARQACRYAQRVTELDFSLCGSWLAAAGWGGAVSLFRCHGRPSCAAGSAIPSPSGSPGGAHNGCDSILYQRLSLPPLNGAVSASGPSAKQRKKPSAWVVAETATCADACECINMCEPAWSGYAAAWCQPARPRLCCPLGNQADQYCSFFV